MRGKSPKENDREQKENALKCIKKAKMTTSREKKKWQREARAGRKRERENEGSRKWMKERGSISAVHAGKVKEDV